MAIKANLRARKRRRRILWTSVLAVIVALLVVVYFVAAMGNNPYESYIGQPVPASLLQQITGVSDATLSAVGAQSGVTAPASISGTPLTSGGKPEVLYIGGDFCPYCAIERWALVVALSHFGSFQGLEYMMSSSTDVNPDTPTFTFSNVTYKSNYITFVPVEEFGRQGQSQVIQALTSEQQALIAQYDTCSSGQNGGIPFVDIGNQYAVNCGAQFTLPNTPGSPAPNIVGMNWTQIASQLNTPSSGISQRIDGAANTLISAICKATGGVPSSVCSQGYANQTLAYVQQAFPTSQAPLALLSRPADQTWTD
ncbi:MAG: DUF929 family protein [Nitrososphaerota archaeon]|nr:DUF929 family protein [Nitrososphaerota archaeon]